MNWEKVKLGSLCKVRTGKYDVNHSVLEGHYPFFTCALEPFRSDTFSFDGSLIILPGNGANVGEVVYYEGKAEAYQRTYVLTDFDAFPKYIYYAIKSKWRRILINQQFGSATNYIRLKNITDFELHLPPLHIQQQIADTLDKADALRQKDQQLLQKYDELAQSIFYDMFGDVINGRRSSRILKLQEVVEKGRIITYGIVQAGPHIKDGIPYIKTGNIKDGKIVGELSKTSKEIAASYKRSEVNKDDIIMSIRATVGTLALLPDELDGANLTQGTARISPGKVVTRLYLYYFLKSIETQNWIQNQVKGATFREITLTKLRQLPVIIPIIESQRAFDLRINRVTQQQIRAQKISCHSSLLFQSILKNFFERS